MFKGTAEIRQLNKELARLEGLLDAAGERLGILTEYETVKAKLVDTELEMKLLKEEHERDQREVEHKIGLHRKQMEAEQEIAKTKAEAERIRAVEEAKLAVREGNLEAERKRFEQEIQFRTERFEAEAATLRSLTEQILNRLPTVNVERRIVDENTTNFVEERKALPKKAGRGK